MIQARCPICSRGYQIAAIGDLPSFPFCSDRCRLIDLGRWIDGAYALPIGKSDENETEADTDVEDVSGGDQND
jgi:endogenous inhibitor of DNA gyrase (YacG/DUF329 family)